MKKISNLLFCVGMATVFCCGCSVNAENADEKDVIAFQDDQLYAVAYLGYQQMDDLDYYVEKYLDSDKLPVHYLSGGDYYLVIPRYADMKLSLYQNDMETMESRLIYEDPDCEPFILQCNVSDIFADADICLTCQEETVEFSPFISLKDGSIEVGEHGLNITKDAVESTDME